MNDAQEPESTQSLFGGSIMSPVPDPYSVYARLRRERPVVPMTSWMAPSYLVVRYGDVLAALKDGDLFSSRGNARGIGLVMGRTILEMEGKEPAETAVPKSIEMLRAAFA